MKIVYLTAGAAGAYCGSCLHDNTLAAALLEAGQDVLLTPLYTPIRTDEQNVSSKRIFYSGINVYLQQKSALFRHTPWLVDRLFESPSLVNWLVRQGGSTDARKLGALTVSMLHGEQGNQRKELDKLVTWLENEVRPDVVHLANSLLSGMAREIRKRLGVPVVSTLSGEDIFFEKIPEPHYSQVREALKDRCRDITRFVAMNHYYADKMAEYLDVRREQIAVIPHGLKLEGHRPRNTEKTSETVEIGFLARICPEKGLHLLVEAVEHLCQDKQLPPIRLRAAGYLDPIEKPYLDAISWRTKQDGFEGTFQYVGPLDREEKIAFLQSIDMMCLPTMYHESKGMPVLEALANAVPVVVPAHGAFPEIIADTGGGLLCKSESPQAVAEALRRLILDRPLAIQLGLAGREAIVDRYDAATMARRTVEFYEQLR